MLKQIIHFSIRNKLIVGLLTLGLVIWGIYQATQLPIDAVPDITDNQVQVITVSPSLGAPDIERLITFPIEQVNSNIPGLKEIRSFSRFGLSVVTIVFNDAVDVYWARQQVAERLQQVQSQIPAQFGKPELAPVTTGLGEIYQYVVRPKAGFEGKYDVMQLRTIQDWIVRRQLLGTPGVAEVASFGGKLKQYEIALNPYKLESYNLTIDEVFTALAKNNQNTGGAYIEKGPTVLFIRSEGLVANEADLNNIVVSITASNIPVLIRDVGAVRLGNATRYGAMTFNDKGEVAGAVVMMLKGENSSAVIKRVREKITKIQKSLPEGVVIEPFLDRTKMVNNAISTVERNLTEGALIVIFVLVLFLGNLRAGLVVASVIPLAMLFAIIMMNAFGVSGNLMSLGAIDFGLIVDGAVIIVEAVMHQLTHSKHFNHVNRLTQEKMDDEVEHSASRMMNASIFGQIIILIVYLPIFSLQGIEGKMFKPMAQTVTFALIGAFILSLTYVPMMTSLALGKKISHKPNFSDRVMNRLERFYQLALTKSLRLSKGVIALAAVLFIISVFILSRMGGEFIPKLEEGDFAVETRVLTGSNINTSVNTLLKASQILRARFPEVEKVVGKNGSSEIPTDPMPIEASDLMIILKDKSTWTSAKTFDELSEKMQAALQELPGVTFGFQYPVQMRFNELISGARQDVVCKIFGEDLDSLASYANKLGAVVSTVNGAADLYVETVTGMPQIVIRYNRQAIAQYGLNIEDINRVINAGFAGQSAGQVYEGEKRFDLVVRLESGQRQNIADVQNLLITTPSGTQIPLSQVADVRITEGPNQIQREDAKRRIIVGFNVRGRDVKSVVNELQGKVEQQIKLSAGYFVTYGGAFENLQEAQRRLSIAVPVSLLLIFLLLYFAFRSVKQGLLIYSAIPLSAIGGILALAVRGMPFSISAGVGFIALFGVAVLNGIVLITEFNRLRKEGWKDVRRVVLLGTKVRLRPVLMTATVASLGFIPMALSSGAGAEVQRPLATVVIGGLVTATFLTLFILPMLYIIFDGKKKIKSLPVKPAVAGLLFILAGTGSLNAQTPITLQHALDTAIQNNLAVRSSELNVVYYRQLQGTARDIPKTAFTADVGQFNSYSTDTKLGVLQTFNFPTVYSRQQALYKAQTRRSQTGLQWTRLQLKEQVKQSYFDIVALKQKQKLLQFADSIYAGFLSKAALRYEAGETSMVEKAAAENQRRQINLQLQTLQADINSALINLNTLLNSRHYFIPADTSLNIQPAFVPDTALLALNPAIQLKENDVLIAEQNWQLQKARLLPDLTLGYSNQSLIGNQLVNGVDTYYSAGNRFHYLQAGIAFSLFGGAQKNRIRAAQTSLQQSQTEYDLARQRTLSTYLTLLEQYRVQQANVQAYETTMLKNAFTVLNAANLQFQNGEINYLEWVVLTNQAVSIQSGYIDAIQNLNRIQIQLQTLSGNNN